VSTLPDERYGRVITPGRRLLLLAAGALALAVALGWIGWVTLGSPSDVSWQDVGYSVRSDSEVQVTFDVSFSSEVDAGSRTTTSNPTAICTVHALNELRTEVGLQDFRVQAGPHGQVRTTVTLRTSERATTGLVKACALA
jgi:hypothetical protein